MAQETDAPDWSAGLALAIAGEVRRHRQAQGLSAQQLADRCAAIGMPIQRSVLANLESGRRTTVTVAEVLVLAHALGVPPGVLMFPVGHKQQCEVLPGGYLEPDFAVDWLSGRAFISQDVADEFFVTPLGLIRLHQDAVKKLQQQLRKRGAAAARAVTAEYEYVAAAERAARVESEILLVEQQLRQLGSDLVHEQASEHDLLTRQREELVEEVSAARRRAEAARDQSRYAQTWAASAEEEVMQSEASVRRYREEIASRMLTLPLLPRELAHLDPDAVFLEDMKAKPDAVKMQPAAKGRRIMDPHQEEEVDWGQVMREKDARVAADNPSEGEIDSDSPDGVAFTQPREAYNKVAAEEIAEALARVLERKGMRLVHRSDLEDEGQS